MVKKKVVKEKVKKDVELDAKIEAEISDEFGEFETRLKDIEKDLQMAGKTVDELNQSINAITALLNRVADRMGME